MEAYTPSEQALSAIAAPLYKINLVNNTNEPGHRSSIASASQILPSSASGATATLAQNATHAQGANQLAQPLSVVDLLEAQLSTDQPLSFAINRVSASTASARSQHQSSSQANSQTLHTPHVSWQPRCLQVAHFHEHKQRVNCLSVSPDQSFVASASSDGTEKIWNKRKLDKDICFRSIATFAGLSDSGTTCVAMEPSLVSSFP